MFLRMLPLGGKETHEYSNKAKNSFSLAPLGERGDRKAVGEGVSTDMNALGQIWATKNMTHPRSGLMFGKNRFRS